LINAAGKCRPIAEPTSSRQHPQILDPADKVPGWDWSILPDPATRLAGHHKLFLPNLHTAMVTSTQLCQ